MAGVPALIVMSALLASCTTRPDLFGDAHADPPPDLDDGATDADTAADPVPADSDGDTISDSDEGTADTDDDTIPDRHDLDSDDDGIPDSTEAGDPDLATPPRDTDGDSTPDFRDADSDDDGLSDEWENEIGTNPYDPDTDADGCTDRLEVLLGSDPTNPGDNACEWHRPLYVFVMYYNDLGDPPDPPHDPEPTMDTLVFMTELQQADVFFAISSSESMDGEIDNVLAGLRSTIVPAIRAEIPDVWFGVGRFEGCGSCPHVMAVLQEMTDVITDVETALTGWTTCSGSEPYTQVLYAIATGDMAPFLAWAGVSPASWTCAPPGAVGWPCFRVGAIPIVVQIGDEPFTEASVCDPATTSDQAVAALAGISAMYIGLNSGGGRADMEAIATGTGSIDETETPLVFDVPPDGAAIGAEVVDAIATLVHAVPVQISTRLRDDPTDLVDTVAEFVDHVEASIVGGVPDPWDPTILCEGGLAVDDLEPPLDGWPDTFTSLLPGTIVCFDIHAKQNWTVPATDEPQVFLCDVDIVANGVTVVDTHQVYFLVPPETSD